MVVASPRIFSDRSANGTITSTQTAGISTSGAGVVSFNVGGVWTGSLDFEATVDGVHWLPAEASPVLPLGIPTNTATANGQWTISVGGYNAFRVVGSTVTSGAANVFLTASAASPNIQYVTITDAEQPGLTLTYNEVTLVPSGAETAIITLVATSVPINIQKIDVSGENIASFRVKINGTTYLNKRTWWSNFNETFNFNNSSAGLILNVGQTLTVTAIHNRPTLCNFETTIYSK